MAGRPPGALSSSFSHVLDGVKVSARERKQGGVQVLQKTEPGWGSGFARVANPATLDATWVT